MKRQRKPTGKQDNTCRYEDETSKKQKRRRNTVRISSLGATSLFFCTLLNLATWRRAHRTSHNLSVVMQQTLVDQELFGVTSRLFQEPPQLLENEDPDTPDFGGLIIGFPDGETQPRKITKRPPEKTYLFDKKKQRPCSGDDCNSLLNCKWDTFPLTGLQNRCLTYPSRQFSA